MRSANSLTRQLQVLRENSSRNRQNGHSTEHNATSQRKKKGNERRQTFIQRDHQMIQVGRERKEDIADDHIFSYMVWYLSVIDNRENRREKYMVVAVVVSCPLPKCSW